MMRLNVIGPLVATAVILVTSANARPVVPTSLQPGDQYYLAFVSDGTRVATSSIIADYNSFVETQAALNPALTGTEVGVGWHAIASTATTDAITNLGLLPGKPIYLLDGTSVVSVTSAAGWLGATLQHAIDHNQFAATVGPATFAWTGTSSAGTLSGVKPLGDPSGVSQLGQATGVVDQRWVNIGQAFSSQDLSLYAVSTVLILVPGDTNYDGIVNGQDIALVASHWLNAGPAIPGDANVDGIVNGQDIGLIASHWLNTSWGGIGGGISVPEPTTLALAMIGAMALLIFRRR